MTTQELHVEAPEAAGVNRRAIRCVLEPRSGLGHAALAGRCPLDAPSTAQLAIDERVAIEGERGVGRTT